MGTKVVFTAIITDLSIEPDSPIEDDLCIDCDICVNQCPVNALDEENKTDVMRCMFNCRPYGFVGYTQFLIKFIDSTPEEQKIMLQDSKFKNLYDELTLGSQYVCFNCIKNCPARQ